MTGTTWNDPDADSFPEDCFPGETILSNPEVAPEVRLWSACVHLAIRDLWSPSMIVASDARLWIGTKGSSFDAIMLSIGYSPQRFRAMLRSRRQRERIFHSFSKQGCKVPGPFRDI